ncbi:MAG: 3-deoxy-8-phosphooctulonate synthase [Myxococcales bacterium]|nr:3-deoxy-8-phosphooctulonate synthase [Myxococcales bacterium]
MTKNQCKMGDVTIGQGQPLAFICGPCVAEDENMAQDYAARLKALSEKHQIPMVFKASFDKANRTSITSYRGPGAQKGLPFLKEAAETNGLPLLVDVHQPEQAALAAEFADVLQIPAFLCRQTDLLVACAETGKPVNVKKGQFLAPQDMAHVVKKLEASGAGNISVTERGTAFGYHNLVVDMRSLMIMGDLGVPVVFDATHSVQLPGAGDGKSGGQREFVMPLARAAVAVGCDAIYAEVHHNPEIAKSDGPNALTFEMLDDLMGALLRIRNAAENP